MYESDTDDDCNDLAVHINPGAADSICDGINNDCTGGVDDYDADGDGLTDCQVWARGTWGWLIDWLRLRLVAIVRLSVSHSPLHTRTHTQERTGFVIPGVAGVVVTDIYDTDSDEVFLRAYLF